MTSSSPLLFTVTRREPELIIPAKPTPHELKPLSDIDDQDGLRFHVPMVQIYAGSDRKHNVVGNCHYNKDPVGVIREALAEALVYYYPWAGRLREGPGKKLVVDCTGEGVLFVEATADVRLEDFGGFLRPPFPCFDELLFHVPGSSGILDCPLLLVQVTRLRCGGFVVALRLNHTMTDAAGLIQFMNAVAELARGASRPSVEPVWGREILSSRDPPRVTCRHREYDQVNGPVFPSLEVNDADVDNNRVVERSFFFGPAELSALKRRLNPNIRPRCTSFELLAAFLWRCRTRALQLDPHDLVRYLCAINARPKLNLPAGYYGNVSAFPAAVSTAGELIAGEGLDYAVDLIKKAKAEVTEEYMRSVTDLMVGRGRAHFTVPRTWAISDTSRAGFMEIDFGWGKPVYGGPASAKVGTTPGPFGFFVTGKNGAGESGVLLLICLPSAAMERFAREVDDVIENTISSSTHVHCKL